MFRIGFGFDVHPLVKDRKFYLGGIEIPYDKGCLAHSDGDTLIHALCDALLGAIALGDIGKHFPDSSNQYKDIDSKILLKKTIDIVKNEGYSIGNIDITICLQKPKIAPYIDQMIEILITILEISSSQLSIKATTTEKLGFIGREDGIAVFAVVLLVKK